MKLIAAYCRVSTDRQKEEQTIDVQKTFIQEWATQNSAHIVEWYLDDGWSGDTLDRPELDRLRNDVGKREWESVVFIDRDRLARTLAYQEYVIRELRDKDIEVIFFNNPLAATEMERSLQQVYGVFAEMERINTAERMRKGKVHKAKSGKIVGYRAPYGYRYIPKISNIDGHYEIYEPEAEIVRQIFNWVANDGYSMRQVIRELYNLRIQPPKARTNYWPKSSIERTLKRSDYYGVSIFNKSIAIVPKNPQTISRYKKIKKTSRKFKPKEEWIEIPVPAILSKDLFDRVQEALKDNTVYNVRNKIYPYLLSGKVYCVCGAKRVGDGVNGHHYYRCAQRIYKFPLPVKCPYQGVNAEILDGMVWSKVVTLLTQPNLVKEQIENWKKRNDKRNVKAETHQEQTKVALRKLDEQEQNYLKAYGENIIDFEQFKFSMKEVKVKREFLNSQNNENKPEEDSLDLGATLEEICDTMADEFREATTADKQLYLRKLITSIYVGERRKATVKGRIPVRVASENIQDVLKDRDVRAAVPTLHFRFKFTTPAPNKERTILERDKLGRIVHSRTPKVKNDT